MKRCSRYGRNFCAGIFALVIASPQAQAACNLIPGTEKNFDSALGALNRPFAAPGESLEVRLRPCDTASTALPGGFVAPASGYVVTVLFTRTSIKQAVVLSTDCSFFNGATQAACESSLAGGTASCVQVLSPADLNIVDRNGDKRLSLRLPDTDARLLPDGDDRTYAGPAAIAVTKVGDPLPCQVATTRCQGQAGLVACVDKFFASDGACQKRVALPTFTSFVALPHPNNYQINCFGEVPPCTPQSPDEFRMALDEEGNILAPIDWRGVLVQQNQVPVPRLMRSTFGPSAVPITLPGKSFVASYTPEGGLLPPIFEPQFDPKSPSGVVNLFGSADAPYTILRIARRSESLQQCAGGAYDGLPCNVAADCPGACAGGVNAGERCGSNVDCPSSTCGAGGLCGPTFCAGGSRNGQPCNSHTNCPGGRCGPHLFNLGFLAFGGVGPLVLDRFGDGICQLDPTDVCSGFDPCAAGPCVNYAMQAQNPVPLEGLEQSADVFAFSLNEGVDGVSRNGDGDTLDTVVTLRDRATGIDQPLGAPAGCAGFSGTPQGRAVVRASEPPFSFPAVATEGDVLAFLEPEAGSAFCAVNGDGDADDTILRVFERNPAGGAPTELAVGATPPAVDAALVVNDRSLAVSNGRVFFRANEDGAADNTTIRVSVDSSGNEGDGPSVLDSLSRVLSSDGRFVAFNGSANNLVPGDPGFRDVFVHDRDADGDGIFDESGPGERFTERASETVVGGNPNGSSSDQAISGNGRFVAFSTNATNLGAQSPCTYGTAAPIVCDTVVLKDLQTGAIEVVSASSAGTPGNGDSRYPNVSDDGRFVVFQSISSNLVAGDANTCGPYPNPGQCTDIFIRDRCVSDGNPVAGCTPSTTLASLTSAGAQVNAVSELAAISSDARYIAMQSAGPLAAPGVFGSPQVYVRDRVAGTTELVSVTLPSGAPSFGQSVSISGDGRFVAFETTTALLPADTNGTFDVYVRDRVTGAYDRASVSSEGAETSAQSGSPQLSADGRFVLFWSDSPNLVPGDTNTCNPTPGTCRDFFLRDRLAGLTRRVSLASDGAQATEQSSIGSLSADGRSVAFSNAADNLLGPGGDTNVFCDVNNDLILENCSDVFVRTVDDMDLGEDLTGDFNLDDIVLQSFNVPTSTLTLLCPAGRVAVAAGAAAFLRPESAGAAPSLQTPGAGVAGCPVGAGVGGGISLNGDSDPDDDVVHYWPGSGAVQNLNRAAVAVSASGLCGSGSNLGKPCAADADCLDGSCAATWIAALVSEAGQNATVLNSDGDADDAVVQIHNASDPPAAWTNVGQAADTLTLVGDLAVFLTPESAQATKLNGDGDTTDRVIQIYEAAARRLTNLKQAAEEVVVGTTAEACAASPLVAFRTNEAAQKATDLNGDGDLLDDVLQVWSKDTGLINTGQSVTPCRLEACDPRQPYRILGSTVKFLTFEADQGSDLNGDGDQTDLILQQLEACTQTLSVIGAVDEGSGAASDPLNPQPDQPVVITRAGRCYQGMTLLLVPASCISDDNCPAGATCQEESIVGTFRETTAHDVWLRPSKALKIKLRAGTSTLGTALKVKLTSVVPRGGPSIPVRLSAADGDCPPGTVVGLPDLDRKTAGIQDTVLLRAGRTVKATIRLAISAAAFATHNAKAPARCRLELAATTPLADNEDPTPGNNVLSIELNVFDSNDTPQTSTHESVIDSAKPLKLTIGTAGSTAKSVKLFAINADFLPAAEPGHSITVTADDGDCPAGTVGSPAPAPVSVAGGAKSRVVVPITATSAAFDTPNGKSPARCTAVITATTTVIGNVEPDLSNNTTHLVIDVVDKTD